MPLKDIEKIRAYKRNWYLKNRERVLERTREWGKEYRKTPKAVRKAQERRLKYNFKSVNKNNIDIVKYYNEKFIEQNGRCLICGKHETDLSKGLHLDHNHLTGELRGLLCFGCNVGLGNFKDNKENLAMAIKYLSKYDKS